MMQETLWGVIAVLAGLVLAGMLRYHRVQQATRMRERAAEVAHEHRIAAMQLAHDSELFHANAGRVAMEVERDAAEERATQAHRRLARTWSSEAVSHRMIVDACTSAGTTGTLITNLVFLPAEGEQSFIAQIDHVLLTRHAALVIEAKYWQGIVFDGIQPATVHPTFASMFDEHRLIEPFSVQLAPDTPTSWAVREHLGEHSPATQVRRQAHRLSTWVKGRAGSTPWFETAVLYSHPTAAIHTIGESLSAGGAITHVLPTATHLRQLLTNITNRPPTTLTPEQIHELTTIFAEHGARIEHIRNDHPTGQEPQHR